MTRRRATRARLAATRPIAPRTVSAGAKASSLDGARRGRELEALAGAAPVDLVVVGGGITGVYVALDAATRGLSVVLLERDDLAAGTSRWSSKLVHGGLRYLAQGRIGIAYESAVERGILMERTAPHLTHALAMVVPAGGAMPVGAAALAGVGTGITDLLRVAAGTRRATLPHPRFITAQETRLLAPALRRDGLRGAVLYWDGQLVDDVRLVVAVARTAAAFGARILTRCDVEVASGEGVRVRDRHGGGTFELPARAVVNATGVWADRLHDEVTLRPSKGAHLLIDPAALGRPVAGLTVPVPDEPGRFVFLLPQPDAPVLVGLTDREVDHLDDVPVADAVDRDYLLGAMRAALEVEITDRDIVGSFAGLRPLLAGGERDTADLSRAHRVLERDDGLLTLVGGKLTTARRMAEDVVDQVVERTGVPAGACVTARQPLVGAGPREALAQLPLPRAAVRRYGTEATDIAALVAADPSLGEPLYPGAPYRAVDVAWALAHEGALDVDDVLDRRTRLGLLPAQRDAARPAVEALLAAAGAR